MLPHQADDASDQFITPIVGKSAKCIRSSQMIVPVCVTTRATERTLPGDFNREHRSTAGQNRFPRGKKLYCAQPWLAFNLRHERPAFRIWLATSRCSSLHTGIVEFTARWKSAVVVSDHFKSHRPVIRCRRVDNDQKRAILKTLVVVDGVYARYSEAREEITQIGRRARQYTDGRDTFLGKSHAQKRPDGAPCGETLPEDCGDGLRIDALVLAHVHSSIIRFRDSVCAELG